MDEQEKIPTRYRIEFIEQGIINYEDVEQGRVFVSNEALDRMKSSYIGKPVINEVHKEVTASEAFKLSDEEKDAIADGVVYDCGKLDNGWFYCDCIIWDLATKQNIKDGYSASCAYLPTKVGEGGVWHGFNYDEEVLNGTYTHMAIVKNPRYENAKVYELAKELHNSIPAKVSKVYKNCKENLMAEKAKKKIFSFLWNSEPEKKEEVQEEKVNAEDAFIEIDGQQVPLKEVIDTYLAEQEEIRKKEELEKQQVNSINPDDEIDLGEGKKVIAKDLIACYQKAASKKNEISEEEKKKMEEEKKNEEAKKEEEKQNSKPNDKYKSLDKALMNSTDGFKLTIMTKEEKFENGKKRYGSKEAK